MVIQYTSEFPEQFAGKVHHLHMYCGEVRLMLLACAQGVGTELNKVYFQYSVISSVTVWEKV